MPSLLAHVDPAAIAAIVEMFDRPDALAHPEPIVAGLRQLPIAAAWAMLIAGVVGVSHGMFLYRAAVVAMAMAAGIALGYRVGEPLGGEVILALCCGTLLAALAWPLMRYAVAMFSGVAGAVLVAHLWAVGVMQVSQQPATSQAAWIAAAVGFTVTILFVAGLARASAVLLTSVAGAMLLVVGLTAVLLHVPAVNESAEAWLMRLPFVLPLAVALITIAGLIMQGSMQPESLTESSDQSDETVSQAS